jgi:hypothetical protein
MAAHQPWQEELPTIFGNPMAQGETEQVNRALFRLAQHPSSVRPAWRLRPWRPLVRGPPPTRPPAKAAGHLQQPQHRPPHHVGRAVAPLLDLTVNADGLVPPDDRVPFNAFRARGETYIALWRVVAVPELLQASERQIVSHRLPPVEPLAFPGTPAFTNVTDCVFTLAWLLKQVRRIVLLVYLLLTLRCRHVSLFPCLEPRTG